jgi:hypothetical protein
MSPVPPAAFHVACATTITGEQTKGINISQPATCISGAHVSGSVNVRKGASVSIASSTITGSLNASKSSVLRLCASTIGGEVSVTGATGFLLLGDRSPAEDDDNCEANTFHGSVSLTGDTGGAKAIGNDIGGSLTTGNDSGRGGYPFELAPQLAPNTVNGHPTFLASTATTAKGEPVDGIECQTTEQAVSHTHAHLAVFANGKPLAIPQGVGMVGPLTEFPSPYGPFAFPAGGCLYWLHVHDQSGIIHMELPGVMTITLGDFFDIWGQPLGSKQVGAQQGRVTAFVNGAPVSGNPREIVLHEHTDVQLDIGGPAVPPQPYQWAAAY